ncbi:hypothetical protein [Streptomyces palmae]|uniref:DUF3558 domain-containing protein n=1 Tax=Streptomyces palmae TaxID=1701085 RepID=A0A4Z0G703_9ACTN|nr:hypothetical protein [Streptomyces palmae]TGA91850.1 hypothetical protein E4099_28065 [Streptomyces palmae]
MRKADEGDNASNADDTGEAGTGGARPRPGRSTGGKRRLPGPPAVLARHPRLALGAAATATALAVLPFTPLLGEDPAPPRNAGPPAAIPDPPAADPCALARPGALARFGAARLDRDYGNFDRCDVIVRRGGDEVDVRLDLDSGGAAELAAPARTVRGVGVVVEPGENGECHRALLPGARARYHVTVSAHQTRGERAPLCAMADSAAEQAVQVLARGPLAHRSPPLPADSLARVDACALLDARALSVVPGVDAEDRDVSFGDWGCNWYSDTDRVQAVLRFDRGQPLSTADGRHIRIGGRDAYVRPEGDGDDSCLVRVVHRRYLDQDREPAVEMLYLVVRGPRSAGRLCTMAESLAASAAARLPSACLSPAAQAGCRTADHPATPRRRPGAAPVEG